MAKRPEEKLSDNQIMDIVSKFESMPDSEKAKILLGEGGFKKTFDVGNDYVLKQSTYQNQARGNSDLAKDYLYLKQLKKEGVPTETPILVTREGKPSLQLQKKLKGTEEVSKKIKDKEFSKLLESINEKQLTSTDFGAQNMGIDKGVGKIYDTYAFRTPSNEKNKALDVARETITEKMPRIKGNKIFRAIAPILPFAGTAYGLMSGDPAQAAEQALYDAPIVGQAAEAVAPTEIGDKEESDMVKAESDAFKQYQQSQAKKDFMNNNIRRGPASIDPTAEARRKAAELLLPKNSAAGKLAAEQYKKQDEQLAADEANNLVMQRQPIALPQEAQAFTNPSAQAPVVSQAEPAQEQSFVNTNPQEAQRTPAMLETQAPVQKVEAPSLPSQSAQIDAAFTGTQSAAEEAQKQLDDLAKRREEEISAFNKQRQQDEESIKEIKPKSIFAGASTWDKIVRGVGMFLGSLTPDGAKNIANMIDSEINRDIDLQKQNIKLKLDKNDARYQDLLRKYGSQEAALIAKKRDAYTVLDNHVKQLQLKAQGDEARARLAQGQQQIELQKKQLDNALFAATMRAQQDLGKGAIPGFAGSNQNPGIVKDVTDRVSATNSAYSQIDQLKELLKEGATIPGTINYKKANQIRTALSADLAKAMFGRSSDTELEVASSLIPDVSSLTQRGSVDEALLDNLKKKLASDVSAYAKSAGFQRKLPFGAEKK